MDISLKDQPIKTEPGYTRSATKAIADDLSVFKSVLIGQEAKNLASSINRLKKKHYFDNHRPGIANMILLAHHMGLVSQKEIDDCSAVEWEGIYDLYELSTKNIPIKLGEESVRIASHYKGDVEDFGFEALDLSLEKNGECCHLKISAEMHCSWVILVDMDKRLGEVVYSCLRWILNELSFGFLIEDMMWGFSLMADEVDVFKDYRGIHPHLSHRDLAELLLKDEVYPFNEIYEDEDDDRDSLVDRLDYLSEVLAINTKSFFGDPMGLDSIRRKVIEWRTNDRRLFDSPWCVLIRQTIKAWKWVNRLPDSEIRRSILVDGDGTDNEVGLDYGQAVGLGFSWEDNVVAEVFQGVYENGEIPVARVRLSPTAIPVIADRLTMLAKARGLIRLAERICDDDKGAADEAR